MNRAEQHVMERFENKNTFREWLSFGAIANALRGARSPGHNRYEVRAAIDSLVRKGKLSTVRIYGGHTGYVKGPNS